jgi:hypothetical protein
LVWSPPAKLLSASTGSSLKEGRGIKQAAGKRREEEKVPSIHPSIHLTIHLCTCTRNEIGGKAGVTKEKGTLASSNATVLELT